LRDNDETIFEKRLAHERSVVPTIRVHKKKSETSLSLEGEWVTATLKEAAKLLEQTLATLPLEEKLTVETSSLTALDTSGAYLIEDLFRKLTSTGIQLDVAPFSSSHQTLFKEVQKHLPGCKEKVTPPPVWLLFLNRLGEKTCDMQREALFLLSFLGEVILNLGAHIRRPGLLRKVSLLSHIQKVGFQALPIIGLIAFLIGIVLVYQGAQQLKRFGAEIFTIDLLAVSVLREIGVLLTAIVVAGRSGSAFTAQIGTMSLNQETDAMRVMGLDPIRYLVIPRLLALLIALPLLVFFANIVALIGGAFMGSALIGVDFDQFFQHLNLTIKPWTFWTGMIKAPVFAFVIALVGCFEGLRVTGGADSVGRHTTSAVVKSIFLVIVLDAAFSILYSVIGI
tara:strand:+ start:2160 stop:3344 length:1185 start_codon:yes stop_codon:yes gene_type:complete